MDQPITENHKEIRNEHASLKEASATEVNAADSPVEVGQGDSAQVNPPSAPSVIVGSSKTSDVQPKGKHNLIAVTQHVNNEPCESVPIAKSISGPGGIASSAVERGADNVVSEDVPAKKCNENVPSSGTLPDNSSRQLGRSAPSASVPSGENGHARGRTNNDALSSKVTIVKESQSYSSIPNLTNDSSEKVTPAPTKGIEPSSDRSKVALEEKQRTEASPSTNTSQECDALMTTNTKEANSKNKVALPSQPEKLKINSSEENENKIPACDIERAENSIDSVSEAEENALTTGTKYVADHQKESGEGMSVHEDSASNSPHTSRGANEGSKSRASEDESLRSHTEKPKGRCSLRVDESRVNLSDNGDDDQEMEEFEHVASKATDGDKDLGEPMSVDIADASVEESMEMNTADEDPFGLANESETKLDDCEEPMEVDDTSDKDKTQDVPESDEIAPVLSGDKESDSIASERLEGGKLPSDADKESSSKVANLEAKAAQPIEVVAEDESNTEPASVNSIGTSGDQTSEEPKDGDEEICIIPDTFRTLSDQTVADGQLSSKDRTEKDDESDSTRDGKAKLDKDKSKEDKSKSSVGRSPGRRDKTSTSIDGDKKTEYTGRPQRLAAKRAVSQIKELAKEDSNSGDSVGKYQADDIKEIASSPQMCYQCCRVTACKYEVLIGGQERYLCQEPCYNLFLNERDRSDESPVSETQIANTDEDFLRKCGQCATVVTGDEKNLAWETMDFCNEECLGKYQTQLGSYCANCKGPTAPASLGKYCVRFGYDIKQFCCSSCLEEFKKGLKVCSYCQKDISSGTEGFLAPVGDKGQFKDFCRQKCMEKYDNMSNNVAPPMVSHECAVCNNEKVVQYQFILKSKIHKLCSEPCFAAFKFVNNVKEDQCDMCKKYFDKVHTEVFTVYYDDTPHSFCCKTCMNVYILANRKIVPCNWCKVKKYNFDMIKRVVGSGQVIMMCSLNCLTLYQVSVSAVSSKRIKCDMCSGVAQAQYHLTMSDATIRNFCSYQCVMSFQGQYGKTPPLTITGGGDKTAIPTSAGTTGTPIPTGGPKRVYPTRRSVTQTTQNEALPTAANSLGPVISSVQSLAPNTQVSSPTTRSQAHKLPPQANSVSGKQPVLYKQQLVVKPPPPKVMRNKAVFCRPLTVNKGVSCRPHGCSKETQTDDNMGKPVLIPIPVPIYVPAPMHMYCSPFPVPVPFPLPIPVPMFIPTTRHSAQGILREIKRIQEKIPTDPFEAELLMMAEMVADDKKPADSDSESEAGENDAGDVSEVQGAASAAEGGFSPEAVDTSNFGEDMLQMALKMASELDEPAVDLEAALTPSTITAQSNTSIEHNDATESEVDDPEPVANMADRAARGRKRSVPTPRRTAPNKRGRRISSSGGEMPLLPPPEPANTPRIEQEKPDANMCLKYTFGVNAWRQWVNAKNNELEKAASNNRKLKLFKPEILQLTSDELNYSLCLFVKEVRKPNGTEYAPDTIYYLVLGIQQYLFENGRIDNIFTDPYYEKFTECLDEVAKKFAVLYNDQQYIVTRVEEEHLWESKQLGAHSPHVLLSTLMFFNTKHFNLTTVEEHMQLSFSHIMKHWKRNPNQPGGVAKVPGSRNVLLRFYPPQSSLEANSKKKKVYEQQENEENPLRCPVKLYEFYLSKCPESVKTRNDVFYLLPERSCVPDSPVWYSTMALGKDPLMKMLHRVKMVKEINIALLQS